MTDKEFEEDVLGYIDLDEFYNTGKVSRYNLAVKIPSLEDVSINNDTTLEWESDNYDDDRELILIYSRYDWFSIKTLLNSSFNLHVEFKDFESKEKYHNIVEGLHMFDIPRLDLSYIYDMPKLFLDIKNHQSYSYYANNEHYKCFIIIIGKGSKFEIEEKRRRMAKESSDSLFFLKFSHLYNINMIKEM